MKKTRTISLSSIPGGGKTEITGLLNNSLENSKALFAADYTFNGPENLTEWMLRGSNYDEWDTGPLAEDIRKIIADENNDCEYLLIEYPFGGENSELKKLIDLNVFIDTPFDIAMARRILHEYDKEESVGEILIELQEYLSGGRSVYLHMQNTLISAAKIIIDGSQENDLIVQEIIEAIKAG
ncbi:hypothetical protein K7I13_13820 [Brucepastera parasyntrophica]|uniref:hypothetical protein n=1 Tax=Brucepastera parasyntrophica TaxID=2880008 RepID=UPI002109CF05|nr:hypothetical protein [Brucepastera parasyntrophica]ULQ59527.1 hypothetical protein K7I13_13820 [Brucepastera parasyntrophica]